MVTLGLFIYWCFQIANRNLLHAEGKTRLGVLICTLAFAQGWRKSHSFLTPRDEA